MENKNNKLGMSAKKAAEVFPMNNDKKLKKIRVSRGYSQQDLANRSNVAKRAIQIFEHGSQNIDTTRLETLCKLCLALDCHIEDILENPELIELYKQTK